MAAQSVPPTASSTAARTDQRRGTGSVTGSTPSGAGQMVKGARITGSQRAELAREYGARYLAGESIRSIATSAHRSYGFIQSLLKEHGIELRGRGGATRGADAVARREAAATRAEQITAELHQRDRPTNRDEGARSQPSGPDGKGIDDDVAKPPKPAKNTAAKSAKKGKAAKGKPVAGKPAKGATGAALEAEPEVAHFDDAQPEVDKGKPRSDKKKAAKGVKDEKPKGKKPKDDKPKGGKDEKPKDEKQPAKVDGKKNSKKSGKKSDKKKSGKDKK